MKKTFILPVLCLSFVFAAEYCVRDIDCAENIEDTECNLVAGVCQKPRVVVVSDGVAARAVIVEPEYVRVPGVWNRVYPFWRR